MRDGLIDRAELAEARIDARACTAPNAIICTGEEDATGEDDESARILVVDDDPQNRDLLARRLERQGFEVVAAYDYWRAGKRSQPS